MRSSQELIISQKSEQVVAYRYKRPTTVINSKGKPWIEEYFIPSKKICFNETYAGISDMRNHSSENVFPPRASAVTRVYLSKKLVDEVENFLINTSSVSANLCGGDFTKKQEFIQLFNKNQIHSVDFWKKFEEKGNNSLQKSLIKYVLGVLPKQTNLYELMKVIAKLDAIEQKSILDCMQIYSPNSNRDNTNQENRLNEIVTKLKSMNLSISTDSVANFIQYNTSVEDFYNRITKKGTCFNYDLNKPANRNGWSLLHVVCQVDNAPLAKALIRAGVFINPQRGGEYTPLDDAFKCYNLELIQLIVENGGITYRNIDKYIEEIASKLLNLNPLECLKNEDLKNNLFSIKEYLQQDQIRKKIQLPKEINHDEQYKLHEAVREGLRNGDVEQVKSVLQGNFSSAIYATCNDTLEGTCLRRAVINGQFEMVKLLVQYGGQIIEDDGYEDEGVTTIMAAHQAGHAEIGEYLEKVQNSRYERLREAVEEELRLKYDSGSAKSVLTLK